MHKRKVALAIALFLLVGFPATADEFVKGLKKPFTEETATAPPLTGGSLVSRLDHAFLSAGVDIQVIPEAKTKNLVLFGYIDRLTVYQIATALPVLREAKASGFASVEFYDKGGNGSWKFDLSKTPWCSRDLCF